MAPIESTSWTVVEGAAAGNPSDRDTFARVYLSVVRGYLRKRWAGRVFATDIEDAVQEVFLDCLRQNGALSRVDRDQPQPFRAFLFGVTRNVARGFEMRRARSRQLDGPSRDLPENGVGPEGDLSEEFDREWARSLLSEAMRQQIRTAQEKQDPSAALRRVELLRLRVYEGRPIREIAAAWDVDSTQLHRQYSQARKEFRRALKVTLQTHEGLEGGMTECDLAQLFCPGT